MVSTTVKADTSYSYGDVKVTVCSVDGKIDSKMFVTVERDFDGEVVSFYRDELNQLREVLDEMFNRGII